MSLLLLALLLIRFQDADDIHEQLVNAAGSGEAERVKALIAQGADPNYMGPYGRTPLMRASESRSGRAVKTLLALGAKINLKEDGRGSSIGKSPLDFAIQRGRIETVRVLLRSGANPNSTTFDGTTTLMRALYGENKELKLQILKMLIARGAKVNARNWSGDTPLSIAAWKARPMVVRLLLSKGAWVNSRDRYGRTALRNAKEGMNSSVVRLLRRVGGRE